MRPDFLLAAATGEASLTSDDVTTTSVVEVDFPPETVAEGVLLAGFAVMFVLVIWLLWRDAARLHWWQRAWLLFIRVAALCGVLVIALNPHQRTQRESFRPSQVILLVDTSTSMQQPADDATASGAASELRWEAVQRLLSQTPLIEELREQHVVDVVTFDSEVKTDVLRLPRRGTPGSQAPVGEAVSSEEAADPSWDELLQPTGLSTRLGDAIVKLLSEGRSQTLSGIIAVSDGANNAGRDVTSANRRAQRDAIPLFAVGVGGTKPPVNLQLARVIVPTDVQLGDAFEITALLQASGLRNWLDAHGQSGGVSFPVDLLRRDANTNTPVVVESRDITISQDGVPVEVTFQQTPAAAEEVAYSVRIRPPSSLVESREDDNESQRTVRVFDRPMKVLMMAGGPMRDYQFAKNVFHRHRSMEIDVWLQTGQPGISQDAQNLLYEFPESREALFAYDVVMAFDVDWSRIPKQGQDWLAEWIGNEGGGLVLVAGDIYTPQLASANDDSATIKKLYPVVLESLPPQFDQKDRWNQPWRIEFTPEGQSAAFLRIADDPEASRLAWEAFPGVFRSYPTNGHKSGATVYARFGDPLSRTDAGAPVLFASQRYGQGLTVFLGSPEMWRLRAIDEAYNERFWINLVRMASEGRSKRGMQRAMLILDGRDYGVGQTVPLRARAVTPAFEPLAADTLTLDVFDPRGRPLVPTPVLRRDPNRPTEYVGDFRVTMPGAYRLSLPVPDSSEAIKEELTVTLPKLEMEKLEQDVPQLKALVEETGGEYLTLEEAPAKLPGLLPNRGQTFVLDEQITELWDRSWVLFLLVGLLSLEWLSRKLMKLA